jgi:hypothetical protein
MMFDLAAYLSIGVLAMSSVSACVRVKRARDWNPACVPLWLSSGYGDLYLSINTLLALIVSYGAAAYGVTHSGWATLLNFLWFSAPYVLFIRNLVGKEAPVAILCPVYLIPAAIWLAVIW